MPLRRPPWPVIGLVAVVLMAAFGAVANLAGLFDSARVSGTPRATFSPSAPPAPDGTAEVAALTATAWAEAAGAAQAPWAGGDAPRWQAMADTLAVHWRVLTGPDPLSRIDPGPADLHPGAPAENADRDAALHSLNNVLADLAARELDRAKTTGQTAETRVEAAWWAGLWGAVELIRQGVGGAYAAPAPLDPLATILPSDDATAVADLARSLDEAVFVTRAAVGRATPGGPTAAAAAATVEQLRRARESLADLAERQGWPVDPAAAAYSLPPLGNTDDTQCAAAVGETVRAVNQAAATWLASTSDFHDPALAQFQASVLIGLGQNTAVWVGWPN
ncbi:MAG: hypothetical protein LBS56_00070 [Propionibacteriaceae bacterium]|jgi:hypothetical protein|nr:hypothetical protein [Propionibacteriaceae bacterium]